MEFSVYTPLWPVCVTVLNPGAIVGVGTDYRVGEVPVPNGRWLLFDGEFAGNVMEAGADGATWAPVEPGMVFPPVPNGRVFLRRTAGAISGMNNQPFRIHCLDKDTALLRAIALASKPRPPTVMYSAGNSTPFDATAETLLLGLAPGRWRISATKDAMFYRNGQPTAAIGAYQPWDVEIMTGEPESAIQIKAANTGESGTAFVNPIMPF